MDDSTLFLQTKKEAKKIFKYNYVPKRKSYICRTSWNTAL